ncbi:MAG TPA: hypothetical protein VN924_12385 [Bryobacteraceae bacterium]|jgi:hypothetical protein|nr:hypothetical protein [Bryobacteraceae bacterium]
MNLGNKISICAGAGVLFATVGAIGSVYLISDGNRVNELRALMSSTMQQAETVTANMVELHERGAFNTTALAKSLTAVRSGVHVSDSVAAGPCSA